ncbi:Putative sulfate ABC transporter, periplasmic sulfate-binding protein [Desulfatibacillum aliphaticivorans]|uniref:Sulfate ABC transporter, periplasmic sulfate-binding protein n=1 Tax=Desulfatibacillum aliphaticivorans TaxID=218208 RepID=B8FM37_DESAL|nr:tungstate ABC transporter substrate-binding protein WtpA [Desulfatibacillum aliphaticivorans]ACL05770.1 Putative sulfate ABC transporter, periplasmic sulfate-binding protein [Desulfatibacillum aliphaticivorans]
MKLRFSLCILAVFSLLVFSSQAMAEPAGKVAVFHAGSLSVPFAEIEKNFEQKYPKVDIQRESGGSTKMARLISEVGKPADIMASADYTVIDKNLLGKFTDMNIRFATNQLVLCYTDQSRLADKINDKNWPEILMTEGVVWGHSDPNLDPCGYRSLMVLQLAESYYNIPDFYNKAIANRPQKNVRPKSVELISLLKTGNMDYAWEYLSVAVQHDLKYVVLPDEINLGNYNYDSNYKNATVEVSGKKPGTTITRTGKSCTYGICLIKDSQNPEAATAFMEYLMDPEGGLKILQDMGQPPFVPCRVPTQEMYDKLPAGLKKLVEIKK